MAFLDNFFCFDQDRYVDMAQILFAIVMMHSLLNRAYNTGNLVKCIVIVEKRFEAIKT